MKKDEKKYGKKEPQWIHPGEELLDLLGKYSGWVWLLVEDQKENSINSSWLYSWTTFMGKNLKDVDEDVMFYVQEQKGE